MLNLEWRFGYRDAHHFPKARIRVRTPHPRGNSVHGNAYRGVETHTHTHASEYRDTAVYARWGVILMAPGTTKPATSGPRTRIATSA